MRLPIGRERLDILRAWLEEMTGVKSEYFENKITNKFPGISEDDISDGVSGIHLYLEAVDISSTTEWYGSLEDLRAEEQTVWVTYLPPLAFEGSRYFQYCGVVSGCPL